MFRKKTAPSAPVHNCARFVGTCVQCCCERKAKDKRQLAEAIAARDAWLRDHPRAA